jgi:hypothetical protein
VSTVLAENANCQIAIQVNVLKPKSSAERSYQKKKEK